LVPDRISIGVQTGAFPVMPDHRAPAPAPRRPHTGRRRNQAARQAVLDAAAELLSRPDGAATSIEEIAQTSGVSKHTIYRWWPSKGAVLLDALVEQARRKRAPHPRASSRRTWRPS
jgi:AcrR family transcriptional regulator